MIVRRVCRAPLAPAALALCFVLCSACGPEIFASIVLQIREPAGQKRLGNEPFVHVLHGVDEVPSATTTFARGSSIETPILELSDTSHVLHFQMETSGEDVNLPTAIGRANPVGLPPVSEVDEELHVAVPLFLAAPNQPELLTDTAVTQTAGLISCNDAAGGAFIIGEQESVQLSLQDLTFSELRVSKAANDVAVCDGDNEGSAVVWNASTHEIVFRAGGEEQTTVAAPTLTDTPNPFLQVVDGLVWVASANAVAVFSTSGERLAGKSLGDVGAVANAPIFIAVDGSHLVQLNHAAGAIMYELRGDQLTFENYALNQEVRCKNPNGSEFLVAHDSDGQFTLRKPALSSQGSLVFEDIREVNLGETRPESMLLLPDGRVVGFRRQTDGRLEVQVEGEELVRELRDQAVLTVGGALLLAGAAPGVHVLVPGDRDSL